MQDPRTVADDIPPVRQPTATAREVIRETVEEAGRRPGRGWRIGAGIAGAAGAVGLGVALHEAIKARRDDSRQDMEEHDDGWSLYPRAIRREVVGAARDETLEISAALYYGLLHQMGGGNRADMAKPKRGALQTLGQTAKTGLILGGSLGAGLVLSEMINKNKEQVGRLDMAPFVIREYDQGEFLPFENLGRRRSDSTSGVCRDHELNSPGRAGTRPAGDGGPGPGRFARGPGENLPASGQRVGLRPARDAGGGGQHPGASCGAARRHHRGDGPQDG